MLLGQEAELKNATTELKTLETTGRMGAFENRLFPTSAHLEFEPKLIRFNDCSALQIEARSLSHRQHQEASSCGSGFQPR